MTPIEGVMSHDSQSRADALVPPVMVGHSYLSLGSPSSELLLFAPLLDGFSRRPVAGLARGLGACGAGLGVCGVAALPR